MVEKREIPKGYRMRGVGVIPEDWKVEKLGDIIDYVKGFAFKSSEYRKSGARVIRVSDTDYDSIKDSDEIFIDKVTSHRFKKWSLSENEIIISTVGSKPPMYDSMVGKAVKVDAEHDGSLLNQNAVKIKSKDNSIYRQFIIYYNLKTRRYLDNIEKIFRGNANQASITLNDLFDFRIAVPQKENEQKAIATALTDIDNLIQSMEKLINKKKQIKQGTMQQLLTGKSILPGFSGKTVMFPLNDILELVKGKQLNRSDLSSKEEYPVINGGIEPSGYTNKWNATENTVTISEGGNSCGYINYLKTKFWSGGHLYTVKLKSSQIEQLYMYQLLKLNESKIMALRVGSGLPNIQKKALYEFRVLVMLEIEEQKAITKILSDIDSEIETLEKKLEKLKSIKQGMMQELLTGRIRLV